MPFQIAKIDKYKVSILFFINTYLFWLVIQTIRGFALTTSYESAFSLIGFALILIVIEFFVSGFLKRLNVAKIGVIVFTIFLIIINLPILTLTDFELYSMFLFIGYGIFLPGFYKHLTEATSDSNNKGAILIVFSFICAFIANLIERYFLLTFNPLLNFVIVFVITPLLGVFFVIFISENRLEGGDQGEGKSSFKDLVGSRLKSFTISLIIGCIFIIQFILFTSPSLVGIPSFLDYDLTNFFIILSYAISILIIFTNSFHFETKEKRFRIMIIVLNLIVILTFLLGFFIHSPIQMILSLISNVILLFLLVIIFAYQKTSENQALFLTIVLVSLIIYLLSSAFGLYRFFLLLISSILVVSFLILLLFTSEQTLSISYNKTIREG